MEKNLKLLEKEGFSLPTLKLNNTKNVSYRFN